MKKIIIYTLITISIILNTTLITLAQDFKPTTSDLIPQKTTTKELIKNLPSGNWTDIFAGIIKLTLQITGSLALISFTIGGIMMITAQGGDNITKGKMIILWSIVALTIIAASYAIVTGITQLEFFT